jgi:DNA polymerase-3 subunit epsilon
VRQKVLWIDLETTGTNSAIHAIIQLAALVEIDNEIVEEADLRMRPMSTQEVDEEALELNGVTAEEIKQWPAQSTQYAAFEALLERYINRYEKTDKFILAGYNINAFDEPFLRQRFVDNAKTRKERK